MPIPIEVFDSSVSTLYEAIYDNSEALILFNDCMREVLREQYCTSGMQFSFLRYDEYRMILQELESFKDSYIGLDIGCGLGALTRLLTDRTTGQWTGIDISRTAVEKARVFWQEESPPFLIGNAKSLPFPDNSIRCIVAVDSFQNVRPYVKLVTELSRVLEHKGRILFTAWMSTKVSSGLVASDPLLFALEKEGFNVSLPCQLPNGIEDQIRISMRFIERRHELTSPSTCALLSLLASEIEYLFSILKISARFLISAYKI